MYDDGAYGDGNDDDGIYGGVIPSFQSGAFVRYYVEARMGGDDGATTFSPDGAAHTIYCYTLDKIAANTTPVVINGIMASNQTTAADPQGDYDDWVELLNVSDAAVDISGWCLSDREDDIRKWQFPEGSIIEAGEHMIVWTDSDDGDEPGLHTNFKLSRDGETVILADSDDNGNAIRDKVVFDQLEEDCTYCRYPDGEGDFTPMSPTFALENLSSTGVEDDAALPQAFLLKQNYPNPFNPATTISYEVPRSCRVQLTIFNTAGQKIATLVDDYRSPGAYSVL